MSADTKIEWATHTFNPWEGCQKVGPGCDHCYAENRNARFGGGVAINWGPNAPRRRTSEANWRKPLAWNSNHEAYFAEHGHRQRVFCASLADVFDNAVDPEWRDDLATVISRTPNLDWLLLTKRIGNAGAMLGEMFLDGPPDNLWLGATIVNQEEADRDIPKLLAVPSRVRFLSMEPLLGPVNLRPINEDREFNEVDCLKPDNWDEEVERWRDTDEEWEDQFEDHYGQHPTGLTGPMHPAIDWVIVGGESGPGARPMHPDWARSLRDQCEAAGVPYLFKQWGEWVDMRSARIATSGPVTNSSGDVKDWMHQEVTFEDGAKAKVQAHSWTGHATELMYRVGKKAAGRELDGRTWDGFPA